MSPALRDEALYGGHAAAEADPGDMLRAVAGAGAQVRASASASLEAGLSALADEGRPRAVVVLGAGVAGLAGDVLVGTAGSACPVPLVVHRRSDLPPWLGAADLVVAVSASGRTEETVTALDLAVRRGSRLVAVAPEGSPVHERARQARGLFVPVPPGRAPGASLWSLATPLVVAASYAGLLPGGEPPLAEVLEAAAVRLESVADRCRPSSDAPVNPAKVLARELAGSLPVIWGSSPLSGVAAARLAAQVAVNAKVPALAGVLPDAAHDQAGVLDGPYAALAGSSEDDFFRDRVDDPEAALRLRLVLLRDAPSAEHPLAAQTAAAARLAAEARDVRVSEVVAEGNSGYERLAELIGTTDYASVYLALLHGVDPSSRGAVEDLMRPVAR
jgi:glucose/mannose-6-phosphate isomerase